jgi:predicted O-linked N-acetylglucosamine transferase (SPINDLY family)/glycosyltransferase involved in cell wall biosynthesis
MRLAFVNPNRAHRYDAATPLLEPLGGSESAHAYLARAMAALGHEVVLFTGTQALSRQGGVETRPLPPSPAGLAGFDALVVLNDPGFMLLLRAALGPKPVLIHWEQNLHEPRAGWERALAGLSGPRDLFAFLTSWQIAHYRAAGLALPEGRVIKLRNAISPAFEGLFPKGAPILAAKQGPPRLVFTSAPYKGLQPALAFFQNPLLEGVEFHLYTGFGHYAPNNIHRQGEGGWRSLYEKARSLAGVRFPGVMAQPAMAEELRAAHVLFYPSIVEETACIAAMEAMAAGLAVVTSDWGALAETTGGLAALIPVQKNEKGEFSLDGQEFARAAARLLARFRARDPALEDHLARQMAHIERNHLWPGRARELDEILERALAGALEPASPPSPAHLYETGVEMAGQGRLLEAKEAYRQALSAKPAFPEALNNLGLLHRHEGANEEALAAFEQALALLPRHPMILGNLAGALSALGRDQDAKAAYRQALAASPDDLGALNNLANLMKRLGQRDEAAGLYKKALEIAPEATETRLNLARLLVELGEDQEAEAQFARTLAARPDWSEAGFAFALSQLEQLYASPAEIETGRTRFSQILGALEGHYDKAPLPERAKAAHELLTLCPFFLAYQGHNDRELMARYGGLVHRLMAAQYPNQAQPLPLPPPEPDERLRLGIVSPFFRPHSIWKIPLRGWLEGLDRSRFAVTAYALEGQPAILQEAEGQGVRLLQGPRPLDSWIAQIVHDQPHILLYPDIGMDSVSMKLAALRLAPLQATTLGHPTTTGLPSMDLFFSSALMEPEGAQDHYTERLIPLPGLGILYRPERRAEGDLTRAALGLPDDKILYWCGQSLFKYTPSFDRRIARIAAREPKARFVFLEHHNNPLVTNRLRLRLDQAFAAEGLQALALCHFLPRLKPDDYARACRLMDVFLDHDSWSGFNSCLEALAEGLLPLTLPGPLMRGRHALAILKLLELDELIAQNEADYIERAARLGSDRPWRDGLKSRLASHLPRIYGDQAPMRRMEEILVEFLSHLAHKNS